MRKIQLDDGTVKGNDIQLERMEIVTDTARPDKIEIYILDDVGDRIEGGIFSLDDFMSVVRKFYQDNY